MNTRLEIAKRILLRLADHRHKAYLVGGFVRDKLLGRPIQDIDIATSATPDEVARIFERTEPTGIQHGTVTVIMEGMAFEVTTFRTETGYADRRRPDSVSFIADVEGDLARRDFTINAMAMTADGDLIDPFGGAADLAAKVLRCVGDPLRRFDEDALRLLRCIRFAAEYGLEIEQKTWEALCALAPLIVHIAAERIRGELERIVAGSDSARGVKLLNESGLFRIADRAAGAKPAQAAAIAGIGGVFERAAADGASLAALNRLSAAAGRWALLFLAAGEGARDSAALLRALTFSKRSTEEISAALRFHERLGALPGASGDIRGAVAGEERGAAGEREAALRRGFCAAVLDVGRPAAELWLDIAASRRAMPDGGGSLYGGLERAAEAGRHWLEAMPVHSPADLAIDGRDLLALGAPSGPFVGKLLKKLLLEAAAGDIENNRERLIERAQLWIAGRDEL